MKKGNIVKLNGMYNLIVFQTSTLKLNIHTEDLGMLLKCRFLFSRSGRGPKFGISAKPQGNASAAGVHITL